jgi:3'-phosphoadenosine 5'-phosphosulfate sulfotransferase (PAPS reductase)/FAD synthetase
LSGGQRHIAACSFGKDSLATILLAKEHGEPLDEAVYCEVMFDGNISGEVPEHRDFIYNRAIPALERMGVTVRILQSQKTYVDLFTGRITRGPKKGMLRSFPICGRCAVQRDCKVRPIEQYKKALPPDTVQYIGIAQDEQERLLRLNGAKVSLLEKYNFTEQDAKQLCQQAGLLSPVYAFTDRGGCWFCPNAKRVELRHLYDHHPDLWNRMLELQALPGKVTEKFNRTQRFSDIDALFRQEDEQKRLLDKAA